MTDWRELEDAEETGAERGAEREREAILRLIEIWPSHAKTEDAINDVAENLKLLAAAIRARGES